jgi:peptidoglycan/LPS O-acetylase OafA/YrhL
VRFRGDIEGLRAVAVLLVVGEHLHVAGFHGGFVGVDVFFVISGYLITSLLGTEYAENAAKRHGYGSISILHFYLRRARRILPAALAVTLAIVIAAHELLNSLRVQQVQRDALWATFFGSNINFIRQANNYFAEGAATTSPFRHYWSLAVEEQFYFVWPVVFLTIAGLYHGLRIGRKRVTWRIRLGAALTVIGSASLAWSILETQANPTAAYFSTFTRAWELALGALLAVATTTGTNITPRASRFASIAGIGLLALSCLVIDSNSAFPGWIALLPTLGAALLIFAGLTRSPAIPNRILALMPFRFIGRISYSLYLWHWPIIVFAGALYPAASRKPETRAALFIITIAVATISYYAIERPFRRLSFTGKRDAQRRITRTRERRLRYTGEVIGIAACACVLIVTFVVASRYQSKHSGEIPADAIRAAAAVPASEQRVPATHHVRAPRRRLAATYETVLARWSRRVATATKQRTLPKNLRPIQDHLTNVPTPCADYRLAMPEHEQACAWGSPNAAHTAAITGDSHAGMWLRTLEGALDPKQWRLYVYTRSWCGWSGTSEMIAASDRPKNKDCPELQTQTLQRLKRLQPDLIVLSESGVRTSGKMLSVLEAYSALKGRVVVLGHTPEVVPHFETCLQGDSNISSCHGTLSRKDLSDTDLELKAASLVDDPYIDTTPWFCDGITCPAIIDGAVSFTDGSHISAELAPRLVPLLRLSLREAGVGAI